jgi:hypothetical protein
MRYSIACIAFLLSIVSATLNAQEPLTNETVLKLVKAGIGEDTIVGMVNQQPGKYALTADGHHRAEEGWRIGQNHGGDDCQKRRKQSPADTRGCYSREEFK